MAGKKFLNPYLKVGLCLIGLTLMGYFLAQQIQSGDDYDRLFYFRAIVFGGFLFLLIRSITDMLNRSANSQADGD
jgi:hypothetical protein